MRLALNLKDITYKYRSVNLLSGEHNSPSYAALNPMSHLPLLQIDGLSLFESLPILEYLEETRPEPALLPATPAKRAQVRAIAELINSGTQPLQNMAVLKQADALKPGSRNEWGRYFVERGLKAVEKILATSAGVYSVGDEVTIADCCLVPQLYNGRRFGVDMEQFPKALEIEKRLQQLEAFQKAVPDVQPDAVPNSTVME